MSKKPIKPSKVWHETDRQAKAEADAIKRGLHIKTPSSGGRSASKRYDERMPVKVKRTPRPKAEPKPKPTILPWMRGK